ncbi:hypothetical protein AJ79_07026 [Helicocarpus griseus UAMH5409]|uniref:Diphthamide biosynthesis protein 4 n=1 Tax=Helicocarpus griseus UAMH5409 TaxID=1447875 RepID=A0A2B7X6U4_9EURO|nr:hypothetical protein AJ79_07026 [Helicocarpus griseus UAMH5409]
MTIIPTPTHYSILNIPCPPPHPLRKPDVKLAYHRALLKHHPDKSGAGAPTNANSHTTDGDTSGNGNGANAASQYADGPTTGASFQKIPVGNSAAANNLHRNTPHTFTIDQITAAYKVLSDPVARTEYDRSLRLSGINGSSGHGDGGGDGTIFRTGMETFDLDDMVEAEGGSNDHDDGGEGGVWYRSCRCGEERGFLVLEEDLEREAERGEVVVGCLGCSLWARVVFAVEEGGDEDEAVSNNGNDGIP